MVWEDNPDHEGVEEDHSGEESHRMAEEAKQKGAQSRGGASPRPE